MDKNNFLTEERIDNNGLLFSQLSLDNYEKVDVSNSTLFSTNDLSKFSKDNEILQAGLRTENIESTPLKKKFYSRQNLDVIQKKIKDIVYAKKRCKISDQNETEIIQIMKKVDEWYSSNSVVCNDLNSQIILLNNIVLEECVKSILIEIDNHLIYVKNYNNGHKNNMDKPVYDNSHGENPNYVHRDLL